MWGPLPVSYTYVFLDTTNEEGEQAEEADWEIANCLQGSFREER